MAFINLQIDSHNANLTRLIQNRGHQSGADAATPVLGYDIKLLEPPYQTTVFGAPNDRNVGGSDDQAVLLGYKQKAASSISDDSLQDPLKPLGRRPNLMLGEVVDQKLCAFAAIAGFSWSNRMHCTTVRNVAGMPLAARLRASDAYGRACPTGVEPLRVVIL